jgi:hypothetical protein
MIQPPSGYRKTWNFKVGTYLFGLTIILNVLYWTGLLNRFLGKEPDHNTLLILCMIMGAISGIVYAIKEKWFLAIVPGLIAGAGSFMIFNWYVSLFHRTHIIFIEAALICTLGALPGFILYFILKKIFIKNRTDFTQ